MVGLVMKAWYVDKELYTIGTVEMDDDFTFDEQYELWPSKEAAIIELKKLLRADIEYCSNILATVDEDYKDLK
jgi:hypothetical protein